MTIDGRDEVISRDDVTSRIVELEDEASGWLVIRLRTDEVLGSYDEEDEARKFIDEQDYDPARVIARPVELSPGDQAELDSLRELDNRAGDEFSSRWREGDINLYRASYFDADWAWEKATETLGLSRRVSRDDYPFSYLDWEDVAEQERDDDYTFITWSDERYYGEDY